MWMLLVCVAVRWLGALGVVQRGRLGARVGEPRLVLVGGWLEPPEEVRTCIACLSPLLHHSYCVPLLVFTVHSYGDGNRAGCSRRAGRGYRSPTWFGSRPTACSPPDTTTTRCSSSINKASRCSSAGASCPAASTRPPSWPGAFPGSVCLWYEDGMTGPLVFVAPRAQVFAQV